MRSRLLLLWVSFVRAQGFVELGSVQMWCSGLLAPRHVDSAPNSVEPMSPGLGD